MTPFAAALTKPFRMLQDRMHQQAQDQRKGQMDEILVLTGIQQMDTADHMQGQQFTVDL